MKPRIVLFDFDGTITFRDSLIPFLWYISTFSSFFINIFKSIPCLVGYFFKTISNEKAKDCLLNNFLNGKDLEQLHSMSKSFVENALPTLIRPKALQVINKHKDAKDICVLISASPNLYLDIWGRIHQFDYILTTEVAVSDNKITGGILGKNCYGPEKLRKVKKSIPDLAQHYIIAYGDSKGDFDLFSIANEVHYKPFRE